MPNYLDKYNSHLLLEPVANDTNSFIANVNTLVQYKNYLENLNLFLTEDTYKDFLDLIAEGGLTGVNIEAVGEDLRRGTFRGSRQLAIDLVANVAAIANLDSFKNSSLPNDLTVYTTSQLMNLVDTLSHSDLHTLYNDRTARVYYSGITVYTEEYSQGMTFTLTANNTIFDNNLISDAVSLYTVLNNIKEAYSQGSSSTGFFINNRTGIAMERSIGNDTYDESRHYIIIYDNVSAITDGQSNVTGIELIECSQTEYNTYAAASSGTYSDRAIRNPIKYQWDDTTSSLKVLSSSLNKVMNAASTIESNYASMLATITKASGISESIVKLGERLRDIRITESVTQLAYNATPTVTAEFTDDDDEDQYTTLTFGMPSSTVALMDTAQFNIDDNGKLTLNAYGASLGESTVTSTQDETNGTITITIAKKTS